MLTQNDELIRRAEDLSRRCERTGTVTHTAFLTPAEQYAVENRAKSEPDCRLLLLGGHEACERRAAFFLPFYMEDEELDISEYIAAIKCETRFGSPSHRDYMGAILALGVSRDRLGDIWVEGERAQIILMKSVARHVLDGLTKVGRCGVKCRELPLYELSPPERRVKPLRFSVQSMRLDSVAAGMFGLSRSAAADCIAEGRVSLNYAECLRCDAPVRGGDIVSLRGRGKGRVLGEGGTSRKGRVFVETEIYE